MATVGKAPNLIRCPRGTCCGSEQGAAVEEARDVPPSHGQGPRWPSRLRPSLFCFPADPPPCPWSLPTAGQEDQDGQMDCFLE